MPIDPEVKRTLDMRLAKGEISQEEYTNTIESLSEASKHDPSPAPAPMPIRPSVHPRPNMNYQQPQGFDQPVTLSKGLYLGGYIGGMIGFLIFYGIGIALIADYEEEAGIVMLFLGMLVAVLPAVLYFMMVYKMWKSIQPYAQTTPGKAVGFMFIPFYNLYWVFVAIKGWFEDYNDLCDYKNLDIPRMPVGIGLTVSILSVVGAIPYIGMLATLPALIMVCIMITYVCNGVNELSRFDLSKEEPSSEQVSSEDSSGY